MENKRDKAARQEAEHHIKVAENKPEDKQRSRKSGSAEKRAGQALHPGEAPSGAHGGEQAAAPVYQQVPPGYVMYPPQPYYPMPQGQLPHAAPPMQVPMQMIPIKVQTPEGLRDAFIPYPYMMPGMPGMPPMMFSVP